MTQMISKNKLSKIFKELALMEYINGLNELAREKMKSEPSGWISQLTNNPDHWAEYGVYTPKQLDTYLEENI